MSQVIECRSTLAIYEDNLMELHNRLTKWHSERRYDKCFTCRERERRAIDVAKLQGLIDRVEAAILGDDARVDIDLTERLGIAYSTGFGYY